MDKIQTVFSINDLVNLTGVNAHSIRKWESRYGLLEPERTDTNIRVYSIESLRLLLNVSLLLDKGYKISQIAEMNESELQAAVKNAAKESEDFNHEMQLFKMAMLTFDAQLFRKTFSQLIKGLGFQEVFLKVIIPLLDETGQLWQSGIITPAHEHFLSNLIRQKLFTEIEKIAVQSNKSKRAYVLFLPHNEFHEISLLFIHYALLSYGKESVYLGQSVSTQCLEPMSEFLKKDITYITALTVIPEEKKQRKFINESKALLREKDRLWIMGKKAEGMKKFPVDSRIALFTEGEELIKQISKRG